MRYYIEESKTENRCVVYQIIKGRGAVVFKRSGEGCKAMCMDFKREMTSRTKKEVIKQIYEQLVKAVKR